MKKNFFKKLSFVLALAMIVSVLAPAAGAFAAKAPKLNASTKYLHLVDGKNEFDFNISNKVSGWKYLWSSANEDVATVNKKNGVVTATGAGKTKVSVVITDKDGEEFEELTATVIVRDNIKELTITGTPADNKLAVGKMNDFNRSYVTEAGKTKGTSGITRWAVSPSEGATITDKGEFTATKAGEYTITARAFQSKAKYTSWLADATKYASYVTSNEATYKVTVAASMTGVKQTNLVKFDLTFDTAMVKADVEKNLTVSYMAGTTKVKELVKGVSMSADGLVATVEMFLNFTKGATYVVDYTGMKAVEFVAATTNLADVTEIAILTTTAELSIAKDLDIAIYNKDKVNLGADAGLAARVTVEKKDNNLAVLDGKKLSMYKVGDTATINATFHTYNWVDGKEVGNLTATQTITCVEQGKANVGTLKAYTVGTSNPSNFNDPKHSFFKNSSANLYIHLLGKESNGTTDKNTYNYTGSAGTWNYTSSNTAVVMVNPTSGSMYGASEGSAVIIVKLNDVQVAACEVTVTSVRKAATVALSMNSVTLSKDIADNKTITITVKDQLNNDYKTGATNHWSAKVKCASTSPTVDEKNLIGGGIEAVANAGVNLTPLGVKAGTYYYNIEVTDDVTTTNKLYANLSVTVVEAGSADVAYYKIETAKTSYDLKDDSTITLNVYGYTAGGVKKAVVPYDASAGYGQVATLEVKHTDGTNIASGTETIALSSIDSTNYVVSGGAIKVVKKELATGTYTIKAASVSGSTIVSPVVFEIKNTRDQVVKTTNKMTSDKTTVIEAVNDCFGFKIGDQTVTVDNYGNTIDHNADNYGMKYKLEGKSICLYYVYIYEPIAGTSNYYAHKVDMGGVVITMK